MSITEIKEFEDAELMDAFIKTYLQEFAPAGYDTSIKIEIIQKYEDWINDKLKYRVTCNRLASCD